MNPRTRKSVKVFTGTVCGCGVVGCVRGAFAQAASQQKVSAPAGGGGVEGLLQDMVLWGGVFLGAMVILFFVQKILAVLIGRQVKGVLPETAIDTDDVEKMARTGLLSDEEKERVRKAIVRQTLAASQAAVARTAPMSAEALLLAEAEKQKRAAGEGGSEPEAPKPSPVLPAARANPQAADRAQEPTGLAKPARTKPAVDLDALLEKGLITKEEYEQLSRSGGGGGS